jgi:uncharacterized membrane protein YkgB
MKPILKTSSPATDAPSTDVRVVPIRPRIDSAIGVSLSSLALQLDELVLGVLRRWSIPALRLALGAVFFWFGALKIFANSPVTSLIQQTYAFLPIGIFIFVLGVWEMLIGVGIIFKCALRIVLVLLAVHLVGTFTAVLLNPRLFFVQGFPLCLTVDGEFVMKNLVLMTAALVVGGHELKPLATKRHRTHNK